MAYIGVSPSNGVRRVHTYTATASQTTFTGAGAEGTTLSYKDSNYVDVYQNGVKLGDADYTATSGTSIVLGTGATASDLVVIVVFDVFSVADTVSKADGGTFDGNVTMAGTLDVTGNGTVGGTLGVTGAVTANAGVKVDNITIDGTEIDLSSGDLTLDVAGDIILDADGSDISLRDGGTEFGRLSLASSGLQVFVPASDADLFIKGNDGGSTITAMTIDMSNLGAVGLGGSFTPDAPLDVRGSNSSILIGEVDKSQYFRIQVDSSGRLLFNDNDAAERMRIETGGNVLIATSNQSPAEGTDVGIRLGSNGASQFSADGQQTVILNRLQDGSVLGFRSAGTAEGGVSISGTTVSFNGGHISRWSRLLNNSKDETIVKGTVMTNLDEMVEWGDEDNEQLNKMAVSSIEGDINVAGVFVNWDDNDDWNDMNVAMTGDMVIRIAKGTTVARGDLLMSAGDGTAKPQGDDIVRSKTIAKVTSTNVSHTYDDGTYLVPCVLMAC